MAIFNKGNAIKAVLLFLLFLVIYNLMGNHYDNKQQNKFYFSHGNSIWPKSIKGNAISSTNSSSSYNVYTLLYNSDNTSLKSVIFNSIPGSSTTTVTNHSNSILLVDSSDFKRKFPSLNQKINLDDNNNNNKHLNNDKTNRKNNNDINKSGGGGNGSGDGSSSSNSNSISSSTTRNFLNSVMTTLGLNACPQVPPFLEGPIEINTTLESLDIIEQRLASKLMIGGWYRPKECNARDRVAIIVPFRDRYAHLPIFLKNIHPFLMKQQIEYGIFIVEQTNGKQFNRAALMNIGFLEALKLYKWDCFIFHDVDLLPLDDRNLYTCPDQPRHMSVAIDIFGYKLPYSSIFGGVSAMTTSQFKKVNGFSNSFWGWGGEDDDMSNRLKHASFHISRYPINIARYMMLNHQKEKANPKRYENLANGAKKFDIDGLNSVKYEIYSTKAFPLYTWFLVELKLPEYS